MLSVPPSGGPKGAVAALCAGPSRPLFSLGPASYPASVACAAPLPRRSLGRGGRIHLILHGHTPRLGYRAVKHEPPNYVLKSGPFSSKSGPCALLGGKRPVAFDPSATSAGGSKCCGCMQPRWTTGISRREEPPLRCRLFLGAGIVRGIDVGDCKGTLTVNLHNRWAGYPSIMVHFRWCLAIAS